MDENVIVEFFRKLFAMVMGKKEEEEGAEGGDTGGAEGTPPAGEGKADGKEPKAGKSAMGDESERTIKTLQAKVDALEAALKKVTGDQKEKEASKRLDEAVNTRISLIESAKAVCKDLKHDGMSNRQIKLAVIDRLLPFGEHVKADSLDDVVIDARYDAAMALAREKAAIGDDEGAGAFRIDEKEIAKKREGRLTMMSQKH